MRWGNLILKSSNQWGREIFIHNMGEGHIHMEAAMMRTKGGIKSKRILHKNSFLSKVTFMFPFQEIEFSLLHQQF